MAQKKKNPMNAKKNRPVRASQGQDIIRLILEDHKPLKKLIKIMKDSEASMKSRKEAFQKFSSLLILHAKPEEQALYMQMKQEGDMREDAFEGDVEHQLAEQMLDEAKRTQDPDLWSARVKVLAELVEHHIKEEEKDMLPKFKKESDIKTRRELGEVFLNLKEMTRKEERQVKNAQLLEQHASH